MAIRLILLIFVHQSYALQQCDTNFCSPFSLKPDHYDISGEDGENGCICRELPNEHVLEGEAYNTFPKNLNITARILSLRSTAIKTLKEGDFENLSYLEELRIEGNSQLEQLEPGLFKNMKRLSSLSIILNPKLEDFEPWTFDGLKNLNVIFLHQNGFRNISKISAACAPSALPNLRKLSLKDNIQLIDRNDFLPMDGTLVEILNLNCNSMQYIHPQSIAPFRHLESLFVGENLFNVSTSTDLINTTVTTAPLLKLINLNNLGFSEAPLKELMYIIRDSKVSKMFLARNRFNTITNRSFPLMPNIELLDLSEALVHVISHDAFAGMVNLKTLLLQKNKLRYIPSDFMLPSLTYLNLHSVWGFTLEKNQFTKMPNLENLDLQSTRVLRLTKLSFDGAYNLRGLGLKNCSLIHVEQEAFTLLTSLEYLDLEDNHFASVERNKSLQVTLFRGLIRLEVLLLGGNGIKFITLSNDNNPFHDLKSLKHLGLERNKILSLSHHNLHPLKHLKSLNISENMILPWQHRIFDQNVNLRVLYASRNRLSLISYPMLEDFSNLNKLELVENPFSCECDSSQSTFGEPRKNISKFLQVLHTGSPVFCGSPMTATNLTVYEYFSHQNEGNGVCSGQKSFNVVYIIPILVFVGIICILTVLVYLYRWHVRYWIFLTRLYLIRTGKRKCKRIQSDQNYSYDAFVSYSNQDQSFVIRLVNMLENQEPFLKLCVYERDFLIGSMICESVLENIAKSRKTLLIVSDSYAKSHWCMWETHIAEHHRLSSEDTSGKYMDDSLVLVKLDPVDESSLMPTLKYLLKTRIHLRWDSDDDKQRAFWEKLRTALAPPRIENINIGSRV